MRLLLVLLCLISTSWADTNVASQTLIINDKFDIINTDMKDKYNLQLKSDHSLILTGYTIQDPLSKLIKTYSVLHLDF